MPAPRKAKAEELDEMLDAGEITRAQARAMRHNVYVMSVDTDSRR